MRENGFILDNNLTIPQGAPFNRGDYENDFRSPNIDQYNYNVRKSLKIGRIDCTNG